MAVVINKDTLLAEKLGAKEAEAALAANTHEVPIVDPEGDVVPASLEQASNLLKQGYSKPTDEHLARILRTAKYSTTEQQLKTAAEGAAKSATFGLSTGIEQALGVKPEAIKAREEINPKSHIAGELMGIALPGAGLEAAGAKVAKMALAGRELSFGAKVISQAVQGAAMQAGDEVHKMLLNDPHQSVGSAIANVGLSGMLTGTLGAGLPKGAQLLGSAVKESKVFTAMNSARKKMQEMAANNPEVAGMVASWAMGHGGLSGAMMGMVARSVGLRSKLSSAAKFFAGHALGIEGDLAPEAAKAAIGYAKSVFKGNEAINQGVRSMFYKGVEETLPDITKEDLSKLDDKIKMAEAEPTRMQPPELSAAAPDHAIAATESMYRAVQYLSSIRPKADKQAPLSPPQPVNNIEQERYRRALRISEQPLGILKEVKNGSITVEDLATMHGVHPELLDLLRSRAFNMMAETQAAGKPIPYKTAMGLSLFLGQPLVSSTLPQNIIANQQVFAPQGQTPMPQQQPTQPKPVKSTSQAFKSLSKESATPGQARELNKQSRTK